MRIRQHDGVVLSPGRSVEKIGDRQALVVCHGCGWSLVIERVDEEPMTNRDLSDALLEVFCEECGA